MRKWQFILAMREIGYTDEFIGEVLALREREREAGIRRRWEHYLPKWCLEEKDKNFFQDEMHIHSKQFYYPAALVTWPRFRHISSRGLLL